MISAFYYIVKRKFSKTSSHAILVMLTLIYMLYLFIMLNFHLLIFLGSFNLTTKICIWFISNIFFHLIYNYFLNSKGNFIKGFLIHIFLLLIYCSSFLYYLITFGDKRFIEIAEVRRRKGNLYSIFTFAISTFSRFLFQLMYSILIAIHFINPISGIRIYLDVKKESRVGKTKVIKKLPLSILKIFSKDLILFVLFVFNLFLAPNLWNKVVGYFFEKEKEFDFSQLEVLIKKSSKINFLFLINLVLYLANIIFFWKIRNLFIELSKIIKKDEKELIINIYLLLINFLDGILDITCPIFILFNYSFLFNRISIKYFNEWKFFNDGLQKLYYSDNNSSYYYKFHLNFFYSKCLDYLYTLLSVFRIFNYNFFTSIFYKSKKEKKNINLEFLFPMLFDSNILKELKNKHLKYFYVDFELFIVDLLAEYSLRRKKFLGLIFSNFLNHFYIIFSQISIINPFSSLRILRNMYYFYYYSFYQKICQKSKNSKISFNQIERNLLSSQLFQLKCTIYDLFIFFPIIIFICLLSPWNFYFLFIHIIKNSITIPLNQLFSEFYPQFKKIKISKKIVSSKNRKFLKKIFAKLKTDWATIIKTIFVHITFYRGILFWNDMMFLFKYKKDRSMMIKLPRTSMRYSKSKNANKKSVHFLSENRGVETINLKDTTQDNMLINHLLQFKTNSELGRKLSSKTINFIQESNYKLFTHNLEKHFSQIYIESLFYLPITFILVLTPWNARHITGNSFFKERGFMIKFQIFLEVFNIFFTDILTIFSTVFLVLSLVKTIDTIVLIYYSIRKYIFKNKEFERYYNVYYKSDFKGQIFEMMRNLFTNFVILGLVLLNVLLITRIPNLIKRIKFYLNTKIMEDLSKFKQLMKIHKNNKFPDENVIIFDDKQICKIAEFLPPADIINLSLSNSFYLGILNINTVWKNCYENYYTKKLKEKDLSEVLGCINISVFLNFKSLCREITNFMRNAEKMDGNTRDRFIGILQILMEETIESFLNIPHLILIPLKIFSYLTLKIRNILIIILYTFYKGAVFSKILKRIYYVFPHERVSQFLDFTIIDSQFYNMQIIGVLCTLDILMIFLEIFINSFIFWKIYILNFISRSDIRKDTNLEVLISKVNLDFDFTRKFDKFFKSSKCHLVLYQLFLSMIFLSIHVIIVLLPIIYSNHEILINPDYSFPDKSNGYTATFIPLYYKIFYAPDEVLIGLFKLFFYSNTQEKLRILAGYNCFNFIIVYANYQYIKRIYYIQMYSDNFIYDIIYFCFKPSGMVLFIFRNIKNIFLYLFFPQTTIKKIIRKRNMEMKTNYKYSFSDNILLFLVFIFPFLANLMVRLSIKRILLINLYAIVNVIILKYS